MIISMTDVAELAQVGGKAAALRRIIDKGFDVPAFLSVAPDAFNANGLKPEAKAQLLAALTTLGPGPYAARSSAVEEDGASHSHAGQFLSLLNLPADEVAEACAKVFKSGQLDSVKGYRDSRGLAGEGGGTAVMVQQMVDPRAAGVAFTADPVSGRRDRIVVSAIEGLGDQLVGGEEDGETYVIGKDGELLESPNGSALLGEDDIAALHDLAMRAEAECGAPQDIEWALEGARLYLLQSRPITTALIEPPVADETLTVFDNSNIVESYPGLVSPLTYSFAQYAYARVYRAFVKLLGVDQRRIASHAAVFDNMLARVDGRVYYNLVNWYRALALLPGFSINRAHMETMMGVGEPLPAEIAAGIGPMPVKGFGLVKEWLKVGRSAFLLIWEAFRLGSTRKDFYARLNSALAEPASTLDAMPLSELAREYRRIEADLLDRWDAPLINDFLCMIAFGASRKLLERWGGAAGLEVHNDIMIGQGDIVSAEPAQRIRHMGTMLIGHDALRGQLADGDGANLDSHPALVTEIESYLEKFADRCAEELKLESVTLDRDPTPLYRAIAGSTTVRPASHTSKRDGLDDLLAGKSVKRAIARGFVGWAKARVRDRENLRFERTRIFGRARHLFRATGRQFHAHGLIDDPDDIFLLTVQEVLGAIEGYAVTSDLRGLATLRRREMELAAKLPDPPERLTVRGAAAANQRSAAAPEVYDADDEAERTGTGCSVGVVTAVARVIRDPRTEALAKGEILVARHTDPGLDRRILECLCHRGRARQSVVALCNRCARTGHSVRGCPEGCDGLD